MPNVLMTMADGGYKRIGQDFTFRPMQEYAERNGFDFYNFDTLSTDRQYAWQWMDCVRRLLDRYDRLFFVSVDCIIAPNATNVLNFPAGTFYGFDELPFDDAPLNEGIGLKIWEHAMADWPDEFPLSKDYPKFLYNTGLMLVDKSHQPLFAPVSNETDHGMMDMSVLNFRLYKYRMKHKDLYPNIFNASHLPGADKSQFLHVMWQKGSKYDAVKEWASRMGYK